MVHVLASPCLTLSDSVSQYCHPPHAQSLVSGLHEYLLEFLRHFLCFPPRIAVSPQTTVGISVDRTLTERNTVEFQWLEH